MFLLFVMLRYIWICLLLIGCGSGIASEPPTGQFYFVDGGEAVIGVDMASAESTPIFTTSQFTFVHSIAHADDTLYMAYVAPPSLNSGFMDRTSLYQLPLGEDEPEPLLEAQLPNEHLAMPSLSADGEHLYFTHYFPDTTVLPMRSVITLNKLSLVTGDVRPIADNGLWAQESADGRQLAYIAFDPDTQDRTLMIADPDGQNARALTEQGDFFDIDLPRFSADGEYVYFAGVKTNRGSLLDRLMGVRIAEAHTEHNIPALWWRVATDGGQVEQISEEPQLIQQAQFMSATALVFQSTEGVMVWDSAEETIRPLTTEAQD